MDSFALFPTPLFVYDPPNTAGLNQELKQRFLAEANAHAGIKRANVGGWHSTPDVALCPEPCFQTAIQMIVDHTIDSMRLFAQSMGNKIFLRFVAARVLGR